MHDVASPQVRRTLRSAFSRSRFVLFVFTLAAAAGLVALGRWTAPTTTTVARTVNVAVAEEPCGTIAPATMPHGDASGCSRHLPRSSGRRAVRHDRAYESCRRQACQRVLERIYLGTGAELARAVSADEARPELERALASLVLRTRCPR